MSGSRELDGTSFRVLNAYQQLESLELMVALT